MAVLCWGQGAQAPLNLAQPGSPPIFRVITVHNLLNTGQLDTLVLLVVSSKMMRGHPPPIFFPITAPEPDPTRMDGSDPCPTLWWRRCLTLIGCLRCYYVCALCYVYKFSSVVWMSGIVRVCLTVFRVTLRNVAKSIVSIKGTPTYDHRFLIASQCLIIKVPISQGWKMASKKPRVFRF